MLEVSWLWYYYSTSNLRNNVEINLLKYLITPTTIATVDSTDVLMYVCKFVEAFFSKTFSSLATGISEGSLRPRQHRAAKKLQKHNLGSWNNIYRQDCSNSFDHSAWAGKVKERKRRRHLVLQLLLPCSGPFSASRVWWWGRISSLTLSAALAKNCVASASVQYSMLVPSMDRIWSPTCNAPHLYKREKTWYYQVCSLLAQWVLLPSNWSWQLWTCSFFFERHLCFVGTVTGQTLSLLVQTLKTIQLIQYMPRHHSQNCNGVADSKNMCEWQQDKMRRA